MLEKLHLFCSTYRKKPLIWLQYLGVLCFVFLSTVGFSQTYHSLAGGNFSQNWTNTGLITTNDIWTGVPSIIGYLGDDATTTATPYNPQTALSPFATQDVIANQTSTNITNGGVAEFEITNPTIALQGSGTADAPNIIIFLNATGRENIQFSCNLRDIDGSADDAIQPIAFQYRVGGIGNYINIPTAFVSDATTGPSIATLVTPVSFTLPTTCNNQGQVEIRVITGNAAGSDEWVGIDDIVVTSTAQGPSLTINDVSLNEGNAGTTTFSFTVSLSAPAGAGGVTFDIATADNTATQPSDYTAKLLTGQTIPAGSSTYTFDVLVNGDVTPEANETFFVNVTNVTGVTVSDGQGQGTIVNDDGMTITPIHDIQSNGSTSPLVGQTVSIRGIVVGDFENSPTITNLSGFYVQEEDADVDADPATSEGIFVFEGVNTNDDVQVGDLVTVTGTVAEFVSSGSSLTQLTSPTIVKNSTGNPIPTVATV